jgi:hypothetical protein
MPLITCYFLLDLNMTGNDFYSPTCNQSDVDEFCTWLMSQGFATTLELRSFRGLDKVFSRGHFGIRVLQEGGEWSFSVSNEAMLPYSDSWHAAYDVMNLMNGTQVTQRNPAEAMIFIRDHLNEIQDLFASSNFDSTAKRLIELKKSRYDRMWPEARQN